MPMPPINANAVNQWLRQFEALPLECDGMTRVISHVLADQGVEHSVCGGILAEQAPGEARIGHLWIEVQGWIIDLCARMWLGPKAPHGFFDPAEADCTYEKALTDNSVFQLDFVFLILAGREASTFERFPLQSG